MLKNKTPYIISCVIIVSGLWLPSMILHIQELNFVQQEIRFQSEVNLQYELELQDVMEIIGKDDYDKTILEQGTQMTEEEVRKSLAVVNQLYAAHGLDEGVTEAEVYDITPMLVVDRESNQAAIVWRILGVNENGVGSGMYVDDQTGMMIGYQSNNVNYYQYISDSEIFGVTGLEMIMGTSYENATILAQVLGQYYGWSVQSIELESKTSGVEEGNITIQFLTTEGATVACVYRDAIYAGISSFNCQSISLPF